MADNQALADAVNALLTKYGVTRDQIADLLGGTVDGGPNANGNYPITLANGTTLLAPCPSKLAFLSGDVAAATAALGPILAAAVAARGEAVASAAQAREDADRIDLGDFDAKVQQVRDDALASAAVFTSVVTSLGQIAADVIITQTMIVGHFAFA